MRTYNCVVGIKDYIKIDHGCPGCLTHLTVPDIKIYI